MQKGGMSFVKRLFCHIALWIATFRFLWYMHRGKDVGIKKKV